MTWQGAFCSASTTPSIASAAAPHNAGAAEHRSVEQSSGRFPPGWMVCNGIHVSNLPASLAGWVVRQQLTRPLQGPVRRQRTIAVALFTANLFLIAGAVGCSGEETEDVATNIKTLIATMPGAGDAGYTTPELSDREAFQKAIIDLRDGSPEAATAALRPLSYEVRAVRDPSDGSRRIYIVQEVRSASGSWRHAWGTYVLDQDFGSRRGLVVEIPHPKADTKSEVPGIAAFRESKGVALLVAGAHRDADGAPDVAHLPESIFQTVQQNLLPHATLVVQFHGFDQAENATHPTVPVQVVVSPGNLSTSPEKGRTAAADVGKALEQFYSVCVYTGEPPCDYLGGTQNEQGHAAHRQGVPFLHIEAEIGARTEQLGRTVAAAVR